MSEEEGEPCDCRFVDGRAIKRCNYHRRSVPNAYAQFLEAKIRHAFKDTHLYHLRDEIISEIRKIRVKK